jgi:DNA-binding transcriptional MerR regulator
LFDENAIQRLRFIKIARDAGVPLAKIVCLLAASDKGNAEETNTRMAELNQFIGDTRNKVFSSLQAQPLLWLVVW